MFWCSSRWTEEQISSELTSCVHITTTSNTHTNKQCCLSMSHSETQLSHLVPFADHHSKQSHFLFHTLCSRFPSFAQILRSAQNEGHNLLSQEHKRDCFSFQRYGHFHPYHFCPSAGSEKGIIFLQYSNLSLNS